ncbi:MAG: class I SAM-dependent methyltransferase [Chloroflexi bacterium]|nr:class I SAM-dependent methyltransferase [Chloroflexota bacterium]
MAFLITLRDLVIPHREILNEANVKLGFQVLDYGCGPGGHITDATEMVGESGKVYALDIHPLALQRIQNIARKKRLTNVETIRSNCQTGLPDCSLDVVLLYDIFHMVDDPLALLTELHRILKQDGTLSFSDHHMREDEIIAGVTTSRLFRLVKKGKHTYSFVKQ